MAKELIVPRIKDLERLDTDAVFNRLETYGVRHNIGELNWKDLYPYHPLTTFTIAHSGDSLFINFFVRCNYLRAVNYANNSPVYEDSCIMFYIGEDGSDTYYSFEFNCIGTIKALRHFSGQMLDVESSTEERFSEDLSDEEINRISVLPSCGRRPFREIEGLFTWDLLVAVPLDLFGVSYVEGKKLKGNFCKCASGTSQPHFLSWAPINTPQPDFDCPEAFGDIILV